MKLTSIKNHIWQRRNSIALLWRESLAQCQSHAQPHSLEFFVDLVENLITLLFADPFDGRSAQTLGKTFAQSGYSSPKALVCTQTTLGQELVKGLSPEQLALLYPRLLRLSSQVLAGYVESISDEFLLSEDAINSRLSDETTMLEELPVNGDLTTREKQILALLAADNSTDTIAVVLGIKPRTVRFHLTNLFAKLQVRSQAAAVHKAWECGLMECDPDSPCEIVITDERD